MSRTFPGRTRDATPLSASPCKAYTSSSVIPMPHNNENRQPVDSMQDPVYRFWAIYEGEDEDVGATQGDE